MRLGVARVNTDILRTPMGIHVLKDDTHLSRWIEREHRLDLDANIVEIAGGAHLIPEGGGGINAGAALGDHAVAYSQIVGASGHVYAFEPDPVTYEALRQNVARLLDRLRCINNWFSSFQNGT